MLQYSISKYYFFSSDMKFSNETVFHVYEMSLLVCLRLEPETHTNSLNEHFYSKSDIDTAFYSREGEFGNWGIY